MIRRISNFLHNINIIDSIIVLVILGVLSSIAWAWFSATPTGNDAAKSYTVETATLGITYEDGAVINAVNVLPGWNTNKTFSVTNTGDNKATYKINWESINNSFKTKSDLVYSITSTNSGGVLTERQVPSNGTHVNILTNIEIGVGVTQVYTLNVKYINRASTQDDQGSLFVGKIEVLDIND